MDIRNHLEEIEENWHNRKHNCANCPKWHSGGFKRPFFGASSQESLEADVVFVGEEPGTGGRQAHEDWREDERISLDEAANRVSQSTWEHRDFPVSNSAMFTEELLKILTGEEPLNSLDSLDDEFDYYITNLEKCHERYDEPDDTDDYDKSEYVGDQVYDEKHSTNKTATDCCSSYLRTELDLLEPEIVVTLGGTACRGVLNMYDGFGSKPGLTTEPFSILESGEISWKLMPAVHPAPRNLNGRYSFSDVDFPSREAPQDGEEARRVYFDTLRDILIEELDL